MTLTSPAFQEGGPIPVRYTQDGESLFPPLYWDNVPAATQSLVLLVEDADAPFPRPLVHAVLHAIPPGLSGIPEGGVAMRQTRKSPLGFKDWVDGAIAHSGPWPAPLCVSVARHRHGAELCQPAGPWCAAACRASEHYRVEPADRRVPAGLAAGCQAACSISAAPAFLALISQATSSPGIGRA
jgi:hypothetical protein